MALIRAVQSFADVKRVSQDKIHAVFTLTNWSFRKRPPIAESILTMDQYWEAGFSGVTAKNPQVIPRRNRFGIDKRQEKQLIPAIVELN
jgi:hypothetical protein